MSFAFPKPHFIRSKQYLAWIRTKPCIVCCKSAEAAHIGTGGTGIKIDDLRALPMCHAHHVGGKDSYHALGPKRFEEHFNLDLKEQILLHIFQFMQDVLSFGD